MKHIQKDFEGSKIKAWELSHGIVRFVRGACEYVMVADQEKFEAECEADRIRHARSDMMRAMQEREDDFPDGIF